MTHHIPPFNQNLNRPVLTVIKILFGFALWGYLPAG